MTNNDVSAPLVIYLRCRPADADTSAAALDEQRVTLAAWLASQERAPTILREIVEDESVGTGQPALAAAIALCKAQGATLVIVSTQSISTGQPYEPRIASVPVTILPQPRRPIPAVISLPPRAGDEVALYVDSQQNGHIPIYLCNPTSMALTDVTVMYGGSYMAVCRDEEAIPLIGSTRTFSRIEPHTAQLVESRDVMNEGESEDQTHVRFSQGGTNRECVATLPDDLFQPRLITLTFC